MLRLHLQPKEQWFALQVPGAWQNVPWLAQPARSVVGQDRPEAMIGVPLLHEAKASDLSCTNQPAFELFAITGLPVDGRLAFLQLPDFARRGHPAGHTLRYNMRGFLPITWPKFKELWTPPI